MTNFINDQQITYLLEDQTPVTDKQLDQLLDKSLNKNALTLKEVATLLRVEKDHQLERLFQAANTLKKQIYGNRIVMFAPLYISNYCINGCSYCGYKCRNKINRRKLNDQEIQDESKKIIEMGHKRIALEAGEDPSHCDLDYIIQAMKTIYASRSDNNYIRRINVNIAATEIADYKRLKEEGIGTYILFQETYQKEAYEKYHPTGPKSNYLYHLTAMDRAMEAGIDDVGIGALFGLYDYRYEVLALMMHRDHLEETYGVGPHTISVPRIKRANDVQLNQFPHSVSDADFKKLVAILRLAVPYVGLILSTREEASFREEVINLGISQISAGSKTDVGGYSDQDKMDHQFELADHRPQNEIIESLLKKGFLPSYCTACYRAGRTGDRFMQVAKNGSIQNLCHPNAILTLKEYLEDYANDRLRRLGNRIINDNLEKIPNKKMRSKTIERLERIHQGDRDLFF